MKRLKLKRKGEQGALEGRNWSKGTPTTPRLSRNLVRWVLLLGAAGVVIWALLPKGGRPPVSSRPTIPPSPEAPAPVVVQPLPSPAPTVPPAPAPSLPSSSTVASGSGTTALPAPSIRPSPEAPTSRPKNPFRSLEAKPPRPEPSIPAPPVPSAPLPLPPIPPPMAATPPPPPRPAAKLLGLVGGKGAVAVLRVGDQTYYVGVGEEVQGLGKLVEAKDRCVTIKGKEGRTRLCTEEQ